MCEGSSVWIDHDKSVTKITTRHHLLGVCDQVIGSCELVRNKCQFGVVVLKRELKETCLILRDMESLHGLSPPSYFAATNFVRRAIAVLNRGQAVSKSEAVEFLPDTAAGERGQ